MNVFFLTFPKRSVYYTKNRRPLQGGIGNLKIRHYRMVNSCPQNMKLPATSYCFAVGEKVSTTFT